VKHAAQSPPALVCSHDSGACLCCGLPPGPDFSDMAVLTTIGSADEIQARVALSGEQGVREVIYTPSGPDVARELEAFYAAAS